MDVTHQLASPGSREILLNLMGQHDPPIKDALMTIIERGDSIKSFPNEKNEQNPGKSNKGMSSAVFQAQIENDATIVSDLIKASQTSLEELKQTSKRNQEQIYLVLF